MFALLTPEETYAAVIYTTKLNAFEVLVRNLKDLLPSFEDVYRTVSAQEIYSEFSWETIKEIYEQN